MSDDVADQLRRLRPAPMSTATRMRIEAAVRATPVMLPQRRSSAVRFSAVAAAVVVVVVLAVARQQETPHATWAEPSEDMISYGLLMRHLAEPERLLEVIDRNRRPIPQFTGFDSSHP